MKEWMKQKGARLINKATVVKTLAAALLISPVLPAAAHQHGGGTGGVRKDAARVPTRRVAKTPNLVLKSAQVTYRPDEDLLVFEQRVQGTAGATKPVRNGKLDGAPVLGYVFPTTLKAEEVGFGPTAGIVALAITSHPDFDDSPLWDENGDGRYDNDGLVYHSHWVVLVPDKRVSGGLSVKEFKKVKDATASVVVPPTAPPDMGMYMDSPGYSVVNRGDTLRVLVPAQRVKGRTNFRYDAVTAYMEVSTEMTGKRPMLGVYEVYSVLSKNLSLPYTVRKARRGR